METLQPKSVRNRARNEADKQKNLMPNGQTRRRLDKGEVVVYRCTSANKLKLIKLADFLGAGSGRKATYTDTLDAALNALAEKTGITE